MLGVGDQGVRAHPRVEGSRACAHPGTSMGWTGHRPLTEGYCTQALAIQVSVLKPGGGLQLLGAGLGLSTSWALRVGGPAEALCPAQLLSFHLGRVRGPAPKHFLAKVRSSRCCVCVCTPGLPLTQPTCWPTQGASQRPGQSIAKGLEGTFPSMHGELLGCV